MESSTELGVDELSSIKVPKFFSKVEILSVAAISSPGVGKFS
jgi:hypothetical protein